MWKDFALYIIRQCNPHDRVVEVGVGRFFKVAEYIERHSMIDLILTDIKPSHPRVVKDDITNPQLSIYKGSKLIYSIRPPLELVRPLIEISDTINATLLIKPITTEYIPEMKLVNYKRAFFYEYQPHK